MTDITQLPVSVNLDLDAEERPSGEVKPPFRANIGGRVIVMEDPANLDWRDLLVLKSPMEFLRLSTSKEDREHLLALSLPAWKFNRLMSAFFQHYDLEEKMAQAQRQAALTGL